MFPLIVDVLTMLILLLLLPNIQKLVHWLILVGVSISKYEVNDGVSMALP